MFNVIFAVLIAYVLSTPYFLVKAFKFGIKFGDEPAKVADEPVFNVPKPRKKPKMTPEQDRILQIISNIDRYNGDGRGQKKVEVKNG